MNLPTRQQNNKRFQPSESSIHKIDKTAILAAGSENLKNRDFAKPPENQRLERADWTDFRTLDSLCRRGGVPLEHIPRLVCKELVDNAFDTAASTVRCGPTPDGGFFVEDDGTGIPGDDAEIASLFSICRPLTSSKLVRLPTRGALGNGLRVVVGAVLASGGSLSVKTKGRCLRLQPQDDGSTAILASEPWTGPGTRIEVRFGERLDVGEDWFEWALLTQNLAHKGTDYKGRSSAWWYDGDGFWTLLQAHDQLSVRAVIDKLEGCGGPKASEIASDFLNRQGSSVTRDEAAALLAKARDATIPVEPSRLGRVGQLDDYTGYSRPISDTFTPAGASEPLPEVPYVVEAWANVADRPKATICVNRTPVTADVAVYRDDEDNTQCVIHGCNLFDTFRANRKHEFNILVNVQCPVMPLTTDGKEPDLEPLADAISRAITKATSKAAKHYRELQGKQQGRSQKAVIIEALPAAINQISGNGRYRYSLRQLFYAIRPLFIQAFGMEPLYGTFTRIISDHETEIGHDLAGIYRDSRGTLYHPHTREEIPLGTLSVEKYERPKWTFNKILYCEKEGFFPILKDDSWPERHDCALLTSKGFATRAVCDVLDLLGETDEPLEFYCIHDADGPGTLIYEAMQEGARARPERKAKIINLGLEADEALKMKLQPEPVKRKKDKKTGRPKAVPVASYVPDEWRAWYQGHRVELNEMTTPQFLSWLGSKPAFRAKGKLIPPKQVLTDELEGRIEWKLRDAITSEILREAGFDARVERACAATAKSVRTINKTIAKDVQDALARRPTDWWKHPIERLADQIVQETREKK